MMKYAHGLIVIVFCIVTSGCATGPRDQVFQTSTIDALLAGVYDGNMSCSELLEHGNFGLGTFNTLDGEMIVLDGTVYQIKADGKVYTPSRSTESPFATVCSFAAEDTEPVVPGSDYQAVEKLVDAMAPNKNLFCAVRIDGAFKAMKTRSVPAQKKPYPPLKDVTPNQPEFEMTDVKGTIVGFRCPAYVKGINVPGYHLHFLTADRTQGGHILAFTVERADCSVDVLNRYALVLPTGDESFANTDLSTDRSTDLNKIEK